MARSITITNAPVQCSFCSSMATKEQWQTFQTLLDESDKLTKNIHDEYLLWNGEFDTVDNTFYVCKHHLSFITCDECKRILTRHQIANAINSRDYNHFHTDGSKHRNFGTPLPAACTDCWIAYDSEIRDELGIQDYPPLPPSPTELKLESPTTTKRMWENPLTLDDLTNSVDSIPKTRIQEENVRYGMAFCANESKDKSVKKLREYLESHPNPTYVKSETQSTCTIVLDGSTSLSFPYPKGKTQKDLVNYLYDFFN
jgi:hypothetical protein